MKKYNVLNFSERMTMKQLRTLAAEFGYNVYPNFRVKDAFPLRNKDHGLPSDLYNASMRQSFDFLICDKEEVALFAVEFDGPHHKSDPQTIASDKRKNEICKYFNLPLLRIEDQHLSSVFNRVSYLTWVISSWEAEKAFNFTDEPFDPTYISQFKKDGAVEKPFDLSSDARRYFRTLYKEGVVKQRHPYYMSYTNDEGDVKSIYWVDVGDDKVVTAQNAMRAQNFPVDLFILHDELMLLALKGKMDLYLSKLSPAIDAKNAEKWIEKYEAEWNRSGAMLGKGSVRPNITNWF